MRPKDRYEVLAQVRLDGGVEREHVADRRIAFQDLERICDRA